MNTFELLEYAAWSLSVFLGLWMLADMIRTDRSYEEDLLTSSKEGEIEQSPVVDPARERDR
ncbi:MAG TPA: hypothetical protein PLW75_03620 [Hyphomicrobium sp.]|nr:hypothetical protein [Hyphomicrobium sp.]